MVDKMSHIPVTASSLADATNKTKLLIYELLSGADSCPLPVRDLIKILPAVTKAERDAYLAVTAPAEAPDKSQAQQIADLKKQLGQAHIQTVQAQTRADRLQKELRGAHRSLAEGDTEPWCRVEAAQVAPPAPMMPAAPQGPKALDPRLKYSSSTISATPPTLIHTSPDHAQDLPPAKRPRVTAPVTVRKPICRGCLFSGIQCDGRAQCDKCQPGRCEYSLCAYDEGCIKDICGKIHSSQVEAREEGRLITGVR